jgi:hypothetical protein
MAFGFSFGKNKNSSQANSKINKLETGLQEGMQNQQQTQSSNATGTTSTTGTTAKTGTSAQQSTAATQSNSTQAQTGESRSFSNKVIGGLEGAVEELLGSAFDGKSGDRRSIGAGYNYLGEFDPNSFVASGLARAQAQEESKMDELLGGIFDAIGGKNNSAAALLGNRVVNQSTANLAGIEGDLTAKSQEIVRGNVVAGNQIDATSDQRLASILDALKGGVTQQAQSTQTAGAETQSTNQTGQTSANETSAQNQSTQSSEISNLVNVLSTLLKTNTNTSATQESTTKGKSSGGGMSLSL